MKKYTVEYYKDQANEWRWRVIASNGRIVADCGEGYKTKFFCAKDTLGCKKDPEDKRDYLAKSVLSTAVPKYKEKDYSDVLTKIKDQGNLGSCVGFGVTATDEFQLQSRLIDPPTNFSEMWVYWKSKEIDEWPTEEGTDIRSALKVLKNQGVPLEKYWPYTSTKAPGNKPATQPSALAGLSASRRKIKGYYRINNLQELYNWLDSYGPAAVGIECANSIFNTKSDGNVPTPKTSEPIIGGHCISIVEYDRDSHYLGFKNSWSSTWGDNGFGYLDVSYYDNGFFQDMWGFLNRGLAPDFVIGD
jgi:C1A family cysteine protease